MSCLPTSTGPGIAVSSPAVTASRNSLCADGSWACPRPHPRPTLRRTTATASSNSPASHCASARPAVAGSCSAWRRSSPAPSPRCPRTLHDGRPLRQTTSAARPAPSSARPTCAPPLACSPVTAASPASAPSRSSPHTARTTVRPPLRAARKASHPFRSACPGQAIPIACQRLTPSDFLLTAAATRPHLQLLTAVCRAADQKILFVRNATTAPWSPSG